MHKSGGGAERTLSEDSSTGGNSSDSDRWGPPSDVPFFPLLLV